MRCFVLSVFCVMAVADGLQAQAESTWLTDFEQAKAAAKKDGKVVLADFTGSDWCGWCIKLKEEVFDTDEFKTWAAKNVVLLELDFPRKKKLSAELKAQNDKLVQEFGVRGYPTILLLDGDGAKVGQLGYAKGGPTAWIELAEAQMPAKAGEAGKDGEAGKAGEAGKDGEPGKDAQPTKQKDKKKAGEATWITGYTDALARAKKERKVILADFTGSDWCGWCIKLKKEVFDTDEFKQWASKKVVLLELDFPRKTEQSAELKKQNEKLGKDFKIEGYPTILFLDAQGKKLGTLGYAEGGPKAWIKLAEKQMK